MFEPDISKLKITDSGNYLLLLSTDLYLIISRDIIANITVFKRSDLMTSY